MGRHEHVPVLLNEVMTALEPHPGGRFIDATLGSGGHASRILELTAPSGELLGLDADPEAVLRSGERLRPYTPRVFIVRSRFDELAAVARDHGFGSVHGVLFDLGVSSLQLDRPERGFSFRSSAPLDMRMGPAGKTAAEIVASASESELSRIFHEYGEERYARRIAHKIVEERLRSPIATTDQLVRIILRASPSGAGGGRRNIHPATRVFQALRIAVNGELDALRQALPQALQLLKSGGRLVVISFHSLEDRIVKDFMRDEARGCVCPPTSPQCICGRVPGLRILTRRPIRPTAEETRTNVRSRSARLRAAEAV